MIHTKLFIFAFTSLLLYASTQVRAQDASSTARHQAGQQVYMTVCFACHQPAGQGLPGMFPPLADSDWVKAAGPERLVRMVGSDNDDRALLLLRRR